MSKITKERLEQLATIRTTGATCSDLEEFEEILRLARLWLALETEADSLLELKENLEDEVKFKDIKHTPWPLALVNRLLAALPKEAP